MKQITMILLLSNFNWMWAKFLEQVTDISFFAVGKKGNLCFFGETKQKKKEKKVNFCQIIDYVWLNLIQSMFVFFFFFRSRSC